MRFLFSFFLVFAFVSCGNKKTPDVSKINVTLSTERFEQDLFKIDTNNMVPELDKVIKKYPAFGDLFLSQIISIDPKWSADTIGNYIKAFIGSYKNVYDSSEKVFKNFSPYEAEIKKGLQFTKYYFPEYTLPAKIVTFIGPLDGIGDGIDVDALYVGLHLHLGKDFSLYKTVWVQETYPDYMSNRFEPSTIAVNALKNVVLDMYPEKNEDKTLVVQMVEKGKRLFVLSKLLPEVPEQKLIGYTEQQLTDSYAHEAAIWNLFVQNNLLQTIDNNIIKNYVGEGPKTQELGEGSPGNIGSFAGWQIVKKYIDKHPDVTPKQLMATDAEKIFEEAKYKP